MHPCLGQLLVHTIPAWSAMNETPLDCELVGCALKHAEHLTWFWLHESYYDPSCKPPLEVHWPDSNSQMALTDGEVYLHNSDVSFD